MSQNFRDVVAGAADRPVSPDAVLLALSYLDGRADLRAITDVLGEDATNMSCIARVAASIHQLAIDRLVDRDPVNLRVVSLNERGRARELSIRQKLSAGQVKRSRGRQSAAQREAHDHAFA